jgi:hypothetical protein
MSEQTYSPEWAPHVTGRYSPRKHDKGGDPVPMTVLMTCSKCGAGRRVNSATGQVRSAICRFARAHLHRDPLEKVDA